MPSAFKNLLLRFLPHPGHLRVSVDHAGNAVVVNVHWSSDHSLTADDSFVLSLVCKHRSLDDVADGIDVGEDSLESGVNRHPASVVPLDANIFKTQVVRVGAAANTDEQDVSLHLFGLAVLHTFHGHLDLSSLLSGSHDLR